MVKLGKWSAISEFNWRTGAAKLRLQQGASMEAALPLYPDGFKLEGPYQRFFTAYPRKTTRFTWKRKSP
jgi:hypothetical protein